jgi:3-oxoacyl-(acyl-carrier-protein) synthase
MVGALLVHAGVTPYATGRMGVQIMVETRRLWGRRGLVPARSFAPGLVASLLLAVLLGAAVLSTIAAWDTVAAAIGDSNPAARGAGRQLGIDLLWALAGGVWTSFVGMAGLLGGYALGSGAPTEPVRAPDIITGTQQQMELPPEESPPPTRLAPADMMTGLITLPPADDPESPRARAEADPTSSYSALPRSRS